MNAAADRFWRGRTPYIACQADPRFSYCLYVPARITPATTLIVYIHGTERDAVWYRNALIPFADARNCLVLAPLFPAGLIDPDDLDNYKNLRFHDIRFDHVLLAMVNEITQRYGVNAERFLLGGFSGGAQFAHRFFYLYPARLTALSIASPGRVTLLDETHSGWVGVADLEAQFGSPFDLETMRRVPVHLLVGGGDNIPADTVIDPSSRYWMQGAEIAGKTRVERLQSLHQSYLARGIASRLEIVPGVTHTAGPLMPRSTAFFADVLAHTLKDQIAHGEP